MTCRDNESTHELSYYVVRGNLEPGKRRGARGRDMDVLSGFPVGHPSWGDADGLPGSRGAEEQAKGLAERAESSRVPRRGRSEIARNICFVLFFYKVIKKSGVTLFVGSSPLTASRWGYVEREK